MELKATEKMQAISELTELMTASEMVTDKNQVLDAIIEREKTMSTGIGHGVAIPHGKTGGVSGLIAAVGISRQGIPFDAIDGQPVYIIVLMAAPLGPAGPHIQALSRISRVLNQESARKRIQEAQTPAEVMQVFSETGDA